MKQFLLLIFFLPLLLAAQNRLALVIGNGEYASSSSNLRTPVQDAQSMAAALRKCGFEVMEYENLTKKQMRDAIFAFGKKLKDSQAIGLFYYSGHGVRFTLPNENEPDNFLIPSDFPDGASGIDLRDDAIRISSVIGQMQAAKNLQNILILDACRSYPPSKGWFKGGEELKGLKPVPIPSETAIMPLQGFFIGYATEEGKAANVGVTKVSPYTEAILNEITTQKGIDIDKLFSDANVKVNKKYPDQLPYHHKKGDFGTFYFYAPEDANEKQYTTYKAQGDAAFTQKEYIVAYGHYQTAHGLKQTETYCQQQMQICIEKLKMPAPLPIKPENVTKTPEKITKTFDFPIPEMVEVEGSTFQMDSNYTVTLSNYAIGKYEVTTGQYLAFCKETKSHYPKWLEVGNEYHIYTGRKKYYKEYGCDTMAVSLPIVGVSHTDALAYCEWLSTKTGITYKLPTEAQWQFAAMGGKKTHNYEYAGSNDINEIAWYDKNSENKLHTIGTKNANELGLFDMSGNVWEWCSDWYKEYPTGKLPDPAGPDNGTDKVLRGGSCYDYNYCRVSLRTFNTPNYRYFNYGFRVVR